MTNDGWNLLPKGGRFRGEVHVILDHVSAENIRLLSIDGRVPNIQF